MRINIIGVPIFYGADKKGPEFGPKKLREKRILEILTELGHEVYDMGDINVPEAKEYNKFYSHSNMKYLDEVAEVNRNLAHGVYSTLASGSFPLIVGGDHSIGLGSISGASKFHEGEFAVVWMDAHGDINTQETSESGNIHGMPLAKAMGIGHESLTNIYFEGRKVKPENVYIIGARDLDEGEKALIEEKGLKVYEAHEVISKGIESVFEEINSDLEKRSIKNIHLSFDMDFIDAKFVPGTGTPVSEGITIEATMDILKLFAESGKIKSFDLVELNTLLDREDKTANLAVDLLSWVFKYIK